MGGGHHSNRGKQARAGAVTTDMKRTLDNLFRESKLYTVRTDRSYGKE